MKSGGRAIQRQWSEQLPPHREPKKGVHVTYCASSVGYLKIGWTNDWRENRRSLQRGNPYCPVWLFGFVVGSCRGVVVRLESNVHRRLKGAGVPQGESKEWFLDCARCREIVASFGLLHFAPAKPIVSPTRPIVPPTTEVLDWLRDALSDGPVTHRQLLSMGEPRSYGSRTIKAAAEAIGVLSDRATDRDGMPNPRYRLPPTDEDDEGNYDTRRDLMPTIVEEAD